MEINVTTCLTSYFIGDRVRFGRSPGTVINFNVDEDGMFIGYQVKFDNGNMGVNLGRDYLHPLDEKHSLN